LLLFAGLSRGFSHTMQNATNYLKCFEYLNPVNSCNSRPARVQNPVKPRQTPSGAGRIYCLNNKLGDWTIC
jgi:hypothetical protein